MGAGLLFQEENLVVLSLFPCPLCATEVPLILAYSNFLPKTGSCALPRSRLEQESLTPSKNQLGTGYTFGSCPSPSVLSSCSFTSQHNLQFPLDFLFILQPPGFHPFPL